ncbi:MAG: valine--tRNA ligase [Candidatus Gastranaerophilales bacterium]|nr:valine--tRNA ligase [Candidatus Gastranaerophilales bacterium]
MESTKMQYDINSMPTAYEALETEAEIYNLWEKNECFKADAESEKPPYSIVIPPPNVTGVLHMGHALDGTLQDILIRYHRMSGYETLWLPGTDHAGIATQNVVEKKLREEGKNRFDLGREKFLDIVWAWANEHKSAILSQFKRLGASFDLSRERFTLDEGCSEAVKEVFVSLYNKGLIYKGAYIVNWCPRCRSAISDIETEYKTEQGHLWEISYPLSDKVGAIVVATTRPETMFGDVAIAVNPNDYKYKDLIGETVIIPLTNRRIPIIADEYVDSSFGTGAVKITPAHDPNDYEVGKRHGLKPLWIMDEDANMLDCDLVPDSIRGLSREEARKETIGLLRYKGILLDEKPHEHNVGHCQRCGTTIEPYLSEQWFVKMKPLAEKAIEAIHTGELKFIPERWTKIYLDWMENVRDWCISRQLWWGHQIPAYYRKDTGEMVVAKENPDPNLYTQDEDVLDTWFSSGLWPFSTMGWPSTDNADFKKFYPTTTLVTGFDIIFFWVARMVNMGYEFTGKSPFETVYIHGLIRDEHGQKMSKSRGNTIDPVEIIDKYGCDALRFTLTSMCTYGGQDIKISDEKFEYGRNFANKIWNASRFVLMNLEGVDDKEIDKEALSVADKWILQKLSETSKEVNNNMKNHRIGEIASVLYDFFWGTYCDWYVELAKIQLADETKKINTQRVLRYVLERSLRLLQPIMPHITEKIWQIIPFDTYKDGEKFLLKAPYPQDLNLNYQEAVAQMDKTIEAVKGLRNLRQSLNVAVGTRINISIYGDKALFEQTQAFLKRMARVENVEISDEKISQVPPQSASCVVGDTTIIVPLAGIIDLDKEIERQNKKITKLDTEKKSLVGRMSNQNFVKNAPKEVVDQTNARIAELDKEIEALQEILNNLI